MSTKEFAGKLVGEAVAVKSYSLWKDNEFRKLINFMKLTNKQQDKIFNDLQVTALLYVCLFLEEKSEKDDNDSVIYGNIKEYMIGEFLTMMENVNVSARHVALWRKLIVLRETEFKKDLDYILKESSHWDVFDGEGKLLRNTWARVIALSLGALGHILGDKEPSVKNPLWVIVRRWLVSIEVELVQTFKDTDFRDLKVLN